MAFSLVGSRASAKGDLLEHHLAVGMSASEVERLLGPLREGWSDETGSGYIYWVEPPPSAWTLMLWLRFDGGERLRGIRLDHPLSQFSNYE